MKKNIFIGLAILFLLFATAQKIYAGGINTWNAFMAYQEVKQIVAAGDDIFVLASDNLYQYNKNDQSITTYDKVRGLSDVKIKLIAWSKTAKRLIAVYDNSNIDLIKPNGDVFNISDLYSKSMTDDKTVNSITINGKYAYLGTGFGIVKVNMMDGEISESYIINKNILKVIIKGDDILGRINQWSMMKASLKNNLLDKKNWEEVNNNDDTIFNEDLTDYNSWLPTIEKLNIDCPKYNHFYEMTFKNNTLYTAGGMHASAGMTMDYPGTVQVLKDNEWLVFEDCIDTITGYRYRDINCVDVDPNDPEHVFAGGRTGLYEFQSGKLINYYNMDNSPLRPAIDRGNELDNNYLMVLGFKFDKKGNLWILNSQAKNANLFVIEKGTNTITSKYTNKLSDNTGITHHVLRGCILDSRGLLWFVNDDYREPAIFCYDTNKNITIKYNTFVNQDGTKYVLNGVHGCAEDKEGNIWLGTNVGPFVILTSDIGKEDINFYQIKVPRNDGTNLADYLLSGVDIRCMAIDGANRKWFGTSGSGVYVISNDNMEEINHFTSQNSDILSDNINSIAINENSGEVYIATDNGLCSYMSDATKPVETMEKDNVYAYPNPVTPEYTGQITILGLTFNADVKITTATGYLVAEGRSNGGTFIWNGCDSSGKRVASGIYNVITATSTGEKGTVCKIAIIN